MRLRPILLLLATMAAAGCGTSRQAERAADTSAGPAGKANADSALTPEDVGPAPFSRLQPAQVERERPFDQLHLRLEVTAFSFTGHTLSAVATHRLVPVRPDTRALLFDGDHLRVRSARLLKVNRTTTDQPLAVTAVADSTQLSLALDRAYGPGDTLTVAIDYSVASPKKGLYWVLPDSANPARPTMIWSQGESEEAHHWFPCYDYTNDKLTHEVIVTTPAGYRAFGNGVQTTNRPNADGSTTTAWSQTQPNPIYLLAMVIGPQLSVTSAWQRPDGKQIPLAFHYLPGQRAEDARRANARTPAMMTLYSRLTGVPYAWPKYDQILIKDFPFGGMENTSLTTMEENLVQSPRAFYDNNKYDLVAHELAHQWFGDLVTCRRWSDLWLNEGFATFMEMVYYEGFESADDALTHRLADRVSFLAEAKRRYNRPIVSDRYSEPDAMFDRTTYQKGGQVLFMLRSQLGESAFWKAMHLYLTRHAFGNAVTADLIAAIRESTGRDEQRFFDEWVYAPGYPAFRLTQSFDAGVFRLRVEQTQDTTGGVPAVFNVPIRLKLGTLNGPLWQAIKIERRDSTYTFRLPTTPSYVSFDDEDRVLKTVAFDQPIEMMIEQLKFDGALAGRRRAAASLVEKAAAPGVRPVLEVALGYEKSPSIRAMLAAGLGSLPMDDALAARLQTVALADSAAEVRRAALTALTSNLTSANDTPALRRVFTTTLARDSSDLNVSVAIKGLSLLGGTDSFEPINRVAADPAYGLRVRAAALRAFGRLAAADARALGPLRAAAKPGALYELRSLAVASLGDAAAADSMDAARPVRRSVTPELIGFLRDADPRVQTAAAGALGELADPAAIPALEALRNRTANPSLKSTLDHAIEQLRGHS